MLLDFSDEIDWGRNVETLGDNSQCLVDRRQLFFGKLDVDYRADYLHHATGRLAVGSRLCAGRSHTLFLLLFVAFEGEKTEGLKASQDNTRAKVAPSRTNLRCWGINA